MKNTFDLIHVNQLFNVILYSVMHSVAWISQLINQYRKCLHRDVASTVQIITVHKIHNSKQFVKLKKAVIGRKQQITDVIRDAS